MNCDDQVRPYEDHTRSMQCLGLFAMHMAEIIPASIWLLRCCSTNHEVWQKGSLPVRPMHCTSSLAIRSSRHIWKPFVSQPRNLQDPCLFKHDHVILRTCTIPTRTLWLIGKMSQREVGRIERTLRVCTYAIIAPQPSLSPSVALLVWREDMYVSLPSGLLFCRRVCN